MSINAQATIDTNDDGKFIRTAIKLDETNSSSIVICDRDGRAIFLLNLFCWDGSADVDVIPIGRFQQLKASAWENGHQILDAPVPASHLIAVIAERAKEEAR